MKSKHLPLLWALGSAALLAGCFGGGSDDAPAPPPPAPAPVDPLAAVPDAARQSSEGLVGYLKTLGSTTSDTREAIDLNGVALPQSDNGEPQPL